MKALVCRRIHSEKPRKTLVALGQTALLLFYLALLSKPAALAIDIEGAGQGYHKDFSNAHHWSSKFDDKKRDLWQKPEQVIDALALRGDERIADLGAGTGYFAWRLAEKLKNGEVYALDSQPDMVQFLKELASKRGLNNLKVELVDSQQPKLPEKIDLVLIVNTYHHLDYRTAYFERLKSQLPNQAKVVIVDFKPESPEGPPIKMRISKEKALDEMGRAGFTLEKSFDLPRQYGLILSCQSANQEKTEK